MTGDINDNGDSGDNRDSGDKTAVGNLPLSDNQSLENDIRFPVNEKDVSAANDEAMQMRLMFLLQEHHDLDRAILALENQAVIETLVIARLKKKKLKIKDEMSFIRSQIEPDIIA